MLAEIFWEKSARGWLYAEMTPHFTTPAVVAARSQRLERLTERSGREARDVRTPSEACEKNNEPTD